MTGQRRLRHKLLILLSRGAESVQLCEDIAPRDWQEILTMTQVHRLGPLLHWRLANTPIRAGIPRFFTEAIAESFFKHTLRSLRFQGEILRVHRVLRGIGITPVFLKGAYLAFHAYPHAALRPLRDLDVLVPRSRSLESYAALQAAGFTRSPLYPGSPAAAVHCEKHLPPLLTPGGQVLIELHTRLYECDARSKLPGGEPADDATLWQRLIFKEIAAESIAHLSPTDQLLHLIVHAVYDHRFNCGPLVLSDIAYLLDRHDICWSAFWSAAALSGRLPGCWLLLHVVRQFYGALRFEAPLGQVTPELPADLLGAAAELMLEPAAARTDFRLHADMLAAGSIAGRARVLMRRLLPGPDQVAARQKSLGADAEQSGTYAAHWWRLATVRLPEYLAHRRSLRADAGIVAAATVQRWLDE